MTLKMDRKALEEFLHRAFPQVADGYDVVSAAEDVLTLRLGPRDRHLRPGGTVSGPTLFELADVAFYLAILSRVGPEALAVTTSGSIDFMRKPAAGQPITAEARINKLGRALAVGTVMVYSQGVEGPVAQASFTYSLPPRRMDGQIAGVK